jgi:tripartite-type tricarboxylate transporter receptor subunit TctC
MPAMTISHVESGNARVIAIAVDKRMSRLPDVSTVSETFPNFALSAWHGFLVPSTRLRVDAPITRNV